MKSKKPTPLRSRLRSALRMVWMRSPERAAALKRDNYTCQICGAKQSKARGREVKVHVHHVKGIFDWQLLLDTIMLSGLFCDRGHLVTHCVDCHKKEKINRRHA
jgi:5-methylcytosine-specific restriction endonuclease McrA